MEISEQFPDQCVRCNGLRHHVRIDVHNFSAPERAFFITGFLSLISGSVIKETIDATEIQILDKNVCHLLLLSAFQA